jgi:hypothetical protein
MNTRIEQLKELTCLFESNYAQYKSLQYDEANICTDFIDKFFALLDRDIANSQGFSEVYREVVREDKVTIDGSHYDRPVVQTLDYSFRIGGFRKYFVEAKKFSDYIGGVSMFIVVSPRLLH